MMPPLPRANFHFRHLIALPGWLMCHFCRSTLIQTDPGHPWHPKRMPKFYSLSQWYYGRTEFTRTFDVVMWTALPSLIIIFIRLASS